MLTHNNVLANFELCQQLEKLNLPVTKEFNLANKLVVNIGDISNALKGNKVQKFAYKCDDSLIATLYLGSEFAWLKTESKAETFVQGITGLKLLALSGGRITIAEDVNVDLLVTQQLEELKISNALTCGKFITDTPIKKLFNLGDFEIQQGAIEAEKVLNNAKISGEKVRLKTGSLVNRKKIDFKIVKLDTNELNNLGNFNFDHGYVNVTSAKNIKTISARKTLHLEGERFVNRGNLNSKHLLKSQAKIFSNFGSIDSPGLTLMESEELYLQGKMDIGAAILKGKNNLYTTNKTEFNVKRGLFLESGSDVTFQGKALQQDNDKLEHELPENIKKIISGLPHGLFINSKSGLHQAGLMRSTSGSIDLTSAKNIKLEGMTQSGFFEENGLFIKAGEGLEFSGTLSCYSGSASATGNTIFLGDIYNAKEFLLSSSTIILDSISSDGLLAAEGEEVEIKNKVSTKELVVKADRVNLKKDSNISTDSIKIESDWLNIRSSEIQAKLGYFKTKQILLNLFSTWNIENIYAENRLMLSLFGSIKSKNIHLETLANFNILEKIEAEHYRVFADILNIEGVFN